MNNDFYLSQIDELTDRERTIFLYRHILKLSYRDIANHLNTSLKEIIKIDKGIQIDMDFAKMRKSLFEEFGIANML